MSEEKKKVENEVLKSETAQAEGRVLEFWNKSNTFKKSEEKEAPNGQFTFYDGPPFATGEPHFGHILAGTIKDAIPRYYVMNGKRVVRKWGWDCHGLPLENIIEKELGLENKKDIEEYGIEKFNDSANSKVLRFADYWGEVIPKLGRWVDMDNSYRTMDTTYTESVWWSFNEIYKKGLIYEGFKSMHYCPRCGTTLSNFEVNLGYKDIKDLSVTVEFELEDSPKTYVLAWTTTPWTLPGNMALAINSKAVYNKVKVKSEKGKTFIVAKERIEKIFKDQEYKIIDEFDGVKIVGKKYKPVFDYYVNEDIEGKENAWKIYGADFVTLEEGTGIVHLAPAFGSDDLELAQKKGIPIVHHVDLEGKFKKEVIDFAGVFVKQKDDHQATDVEIIKYLAGKGLLFSKEKIEHSYPHCWRCATPLLNYATSSWFLETTKIKDKIISENKAIKWVPENIRDGRMGKWLEGMRDWAISRSRYWGAPLPVWKCEECEKIKVVGSIDEIRKETKSSNQYFVIRHGEAENNVKKVCSSSDYKIHPLTEKGKEEVLKSVKELKGKGINRIIFSPLLRTKETADILAKELGVKNIESDERLKEIQSGVWEGKPYDECGDLFHDLPRYFEEASEGGENLQDVKKRVIDFLIEIDKKYSNEKILFVTHERPHWMLVVGAQFMDKKDSLSWLDKDKGVSNSEWHELDFAPMPYNRKYELDLHRPYIDDVEFGCACGGKMKIIKEVFDCWYESGSMPYASKHYPFENLDVFNPKKGIGYPANFIAEGLDQTRGWFYSMLVLSVALFDKAAYQNVVVSGMVLAEDGQKMSKSKKNFSDPMDVVNKFSADAVRYYLLSSPLMKAEDFNFVDKGVDEVLKKNILRFKNVLSFYELYKNTKTEDLNPLESENVLDQWILARLNELILEVTKNMDNYEIDKAVRPIADFVDDLSTWYLRRSRDRFKMSVNSEEFTDTRNNAEQTQKNAEIIEDKDFAIATTKYVLENLAKIYAPFMPFVAEEIWQKVTENNFENEDKSVHLENWFEAEDVDKNILEEMGEVRRIISLGLEIRAKEGIKVRQPLNELKVKSSKLSPHRRPAEEAEKLKGLLELMKDELNVKKVIFNENIEDEVELDLGITLELEKEGNFREFLRNVQIFRKDSGLQAHDEINLVIETDEKGKELLEKFESELKRVAGINQISFEDKLQDTKEIIIKDFIFKIKIS